MGTGQHRTAWALLTAAPALALLAVALLARAEGPRGLFQADLAALVLAAGVAAFAVRARWLLLLGVPVGAVLVALAHLVVGGGLEGGLALALLAFAVAAAASGLAAVGRGVGAPRLTAGAIGAAVLWIAMTGLFWADPLAETLPPARQYRFRQAVLHLDAATACAYDAAGFDRMHDERVYRDVPLAASLVRAPSAGATGLAWLVFGVLAWGVAALVGADRARPVPHAG